jgi:hypothetical protein
VTHATAQATKVEDERTARLRSCRHYEAEARINADAQRDVARINADAELVRKHDYKFLHHPPPPYGDDSVDVMQVDQQIGTYPDQDRAYAAAQRDLAPQRDDVQPAQLAPPLPDASADSSLGEARERPLPDWLVEEPELLAAVPALPVSQRKGYDSDEWYTPAWVIDAARAVLGQIDLDPASCARAQDVVKAGHYWVREDDSLQQDQAYVARLDAFFRTQGGLQLPP